MEIVVTRQNQLHDFEVEPYCDSQQSICHLFLMMAAVTPCEGIIEKEKLAINGLKEKELDLEEEIENTAEAAKKRKRRKKKKKTGEVISAIWLHIFTLFLLEDSCAEM